MGNPERIIYVPLGDKVHPDLELAASYEAWKLSREIQIEEKSRERLVRVGIDSLQRIPGVSEFFYLRYPIQSLGGYLVTIEEIKILNKKL